MKISTIFFDLGKVLVDYDFNLAFYKMSQNSTLSSEEIEAKTPQAEPLLNEYESGRIETPEFFQTLKDLFEFQGSSEELIDIWSDIFSPLEEHIQLARQLSEYYPLAMISNTSDAHIRFLEERYDLFDLFRERIYSYQFGTMKPDPSIYHHALEKMGADKYESLFIDDREENILTPSKMGWQTIHLRPDVDLRIALQSYDLTGI
ncbi:MAG: HAD family phosphatase [Verrucomicrobiota bacterium]